VVAESLTTACADGVAVAAVAGFADLAAARLVARGCVPVSLAVVCDPDGLADGPADEVVAVMGLACPGEDSISVATTATTAPPAPTPAATGQRRRRGAGAPAAGAAVVRLPA
jgi:hypothetical protein